jgi:sugar lactone lactonase YvrE
VTAPVLQTLLEGLAFPESPRWHDGRLWLSEKRAGRVLRLEPSGQATCVATVPGEPSGLGWLPDGRMLVVSMSDCRLLRRDPGGLVEVADLSAHARGKCNDMVVDRAGRAYVGHFGYDLAAGAAPAPASLLLVSLDRVVEEVAGDLQFPNGCVISSDGRMLVVAESAANRLTAFTIGQHGQLTDRRLFADLGTTVPDGICLDAEGAIWVADPINCEVVRVLEGGLVTDRISTTDRGAFACVLGGPDGRSLFICTYSSEASLTDGAAVGRLEVVTAAVPSGNSP